MAIKYIFKIVKVFLLFTMCTLLFYYGMILVKGEYEDYRRYDEPRGTALKVSTEIDEEQSSLLSRILLFYLNGE